jgi:hypothetical protein
VVPSSPRGQFPYEEPTGGARILGFDRHILSENLVAVSCFSTPPAD